MTKNVTFNISQETIDKLTYVKDEYGISKNVLVDKAVNAYINEERFLKKEQYILVMEVVGEIHYEITIICNSLEEIESELQKHKDQYFDALLNHHIYKISERIK